MPTVYVTAPPEAAEELARGLVEGRLAACVNRVDCTSTYRWDGDVVTDEEEILLVKTTDERYPAVREHIAEHHPYEVPCIERFDEAGMLPAFAAWIEASTETEASTESHD